jgi:hypothetical protein
MLPHAMNACATIAFLVAITVGCDIKAPPGGSGAPEAGVAPDGPVQPSPISSDYDPLAMAIASIGKTQNREAVIPPQCYTKTEGVSNPCWTCHTVTRFPNAMTDWELQAEYAFSDVGLTNHWENLFVDRSQAIAAISDDEILAYIRQDNYSPLREAMERASSYPGYVPDLDFRLGFDPQGFARDGSGWRAFRYKPFLGTFWPTNGSTDDVMIRLPAAFRRAQDGSESLAIYKINLAILEASMSASPDIANSQVVWPTEPLDETAAGRDLDGDGVLSTSINRLVGLPGTYMGGAADIEVMRSVYPRGTEFLHSVRYIDPDQPSLIATRMKELRYSRKVLFLDRWAILKAYEDEHDAKDEGRLPLFTGSPLVGLRNDFGWQLQAFIEAEDGRLRLQTEEEHLFCMGCHSTVGVTVDQSFAFQRKLPGAAGWAYQDVRGMADVPQIGHAAPEILTYFRRVGGGDEFRANQEILDRFFPGGALDEAQVLRAAPGGDQDISFLIAPSRERALLLDKAYRAVVMQQRFDLGRDAIITPPANVHTRIQNGATDLDKTGRIFLDGQLRLDWPAQAP